MKFEGIYTPVVTPHTDTFDIDRDRFVATINMLIDTGVAGVIVAGTTGEYYAQTADERLELMQLAHSAINDRVPLIVGTGAIRTEDSIYIAEHAKKAGASALLVSTPPYAYPTPHEIALHALAIDKAANLPVMLYNYPGRMSVSMDEETLDQLKRSPKFAPEAHIALYQACPVEGNFDKGRRIMSAMLPLMRVLEQGGKFVQYIKHGLTLRGIEAGPPRKPLQPLNKEDERELEEVTSAMNTTIDQIEQGYMA